MITPVKTSMKRVLVTEKLSPTGLEILRETVEVLEEYSLSESDLIQALKQVDGVIIRSKTQLTAEVIEQAGTLQVIGRAGIGYDNVDLDAASRKGILVMNVPEGSTISACEHTFGLILALARRIPLAAALMRSGKWNRSLVGVELDGKTLGIIGLGRIGAEVGRRAQAFGMDILVHDPYLSEEKAQALSVKKTDLDTLLSMADVITLHVPLVEATRGILSRTAFSKVKPDVLIVNCSRGAVIDQEALVEALEGDRIGGVALDVFEVEPPDFDVPLFTRKFDKLVTTPHLGASTAEAQEKVAVSIARQVKNALSGEGYCNSVNLPRVSREMAEKLKPYLRLVEKLASFMLQWTRSSRDLEVSYEGEVSTLDTDYLALAILKGCLTQISDQIVNHVNAPILAAEHDLQLTTAKRTGVSTASHRSRVRLSVLCGPGEASREAAVTGVLGEDGQPRLRRLDHYGVDFPLEGTILMIVHSDRPGVVGRIGSILGNSKVNIGRMEVLRSDEVGRAMMLITVDSAIAPRVLTNICELDEIHQASTIQL